MTLSNDLISQFVKTTIDKTKTKTVVTRYGTVVMDGNNTYVKFDGADILTPVTTVTSVNNGDRVTVQIKDHVATVAGNVSSPSVNGAVVQGAVTESEGKLTNSFNQSLSNQKDELTGTFTSTISSTKQELVNQISNQNLELLGKIETEKLAIIDLMESQELELLNELAKNLEYVNGEINAAVGELKAEYIEADRIVAENIKAEYLEADKAIIDDLEVTNAEIYNINATFGEFKELTTDKFEANDAVIKNLTADYGSFKELATDKFTANEAEIETLKAKDVEISGTLTATNANIGTLNAEFGSFKNLTAEKFTANEAEINSLKAKDAEITGTLNATNVNVGNLNADIADINTLIFGSASGTTIHSSFASAVIAQLGNAQITSAMIQSVAADKITAGDIITNNVRVMSEDGSLVISDETMQISDSNRVRVQIGKDAAGDYSINIWDDTGKLMFSKGGITDSAIKDAIIRNDMVSENANISASKLNIPSLFEEMNADGSHTLKSSLILLDEENQTLNVAFNQMTTKVTEVDSIANQAKDQSTTNASNIVNLTKTTTSQGTDISTIQGQISSKIWESDIETAIKNIDIGGRNLLRNTGDFANAFRSGAWDIVTEDGYTYATIIPTSAGAWSHIVLRPLLPIDTIKDKTITVSVEVRTDKFNELQSVSNPVYVDLNIYKTINDETRIGYKSHSFNASIFKNSEWTKISYTLDVNISDLTKVNSSTSIDEFLYFSVALFNHSTYKIDFRYPKLEIGNTVSDWSPAPEDLEGEVTKLTTKYSDLVQTVDSISATVGEHKTELDGEITNVKTNMSKLEVNLEGFKTLVSENYSTTEEITGQLNELQNGIEDDMSELENGLNETINGVITRVGSAETAINQNKNAIELRAKTTDIQATYATKQSVTDVQNNLDNLEIGARNLIHNSNFAYGSEKWVSANTNFAVEDDTTYGKCLKFSAGSAGSDSFRIYQATAYFGHTTGETYTLSFMAKAATSGTELQSNVAGNSNYNAKNYTLSTTWQKFTHTYKAAYNGSLTFWAVQANKTVYITNVKVEKGSKATDWTPAPEDIDTEFEKVSERIATAEADIKLLPNQITLSVNETIQETKTNLEGQIGAAKSDLEGQVSDAVADMEESVDNKLKSYSTTSQMNSAIDQKAGSITSTVNATIKETKEYLEGRDDTNKSNLEGQINTAKSNLEGQISDAVDDMDESVNNKLKSYSTTSQMNSAIDQKADSITSTVTATITETKEYLEGQVGATKSDLEGQIDTAKSDMEANVNNKLKSYSTTSQMNSAIDQKANQITQTVSETYTTKVELADSVEDVEENVNNKLKSYSTTSQMNSAIDQKAGQITSTVNQTIETTKSSLEGQISDVDDKFKNYSTTTEMNSAIDQKAGEINLSVSQNYSTKSETSTAVQNGVNTLEGKVNTKFENYPTKSEMNSAIQVKADSITSTVSATYTTKTESSNLKGNLEGQIGSTKTDLEGQIGSTKTDLEGQITDTKSDLEGQIDDVETQLISAKSEIKQTTDGIALSVTQTQQNLDNLKIGASNILKNSNFFNGIDYWTNVNLSVSKHTDSVYGTALAFYSESAGSANYRLYYDTNSFTHAANETYTLSFMAKASTATQLQSNVAGSGTNAVNHSLTTSWKRFTKTYTAGASGSLTFWPVSANVTIYLTNVQLEKGNKATEWYPHPEDSLKRAEASFAVTAEGIRGEIKDVEEGLSSSLTQTVNSINGTISGLDGRIGQLELTDKSFSTSISDINGEIANLKLTDESFTTSISDINGEIATLKLTNDDFTIQFGSVNETIRETKSNLEGQIGAAKSDLEGQISNVDDKADAAQNTANSSVNARNGYSIKWNYSAFSTSNPGEAYICAKDKTTNALSDASGTVMFNGVTRSVTRGMINPNQALPYNVTVYIVMRLTSASATAGTNYLVWYNSGWKYSVIDLASSTTISAWTWTEATDIVLGSFVIPGSEKDFVDCQIFEPALTASQVTTGSTSHALAQNAQSTANTANNTANTASGKADAAQQAADRAQDTADSKNTTYEGPGSPNYSSGTYINQVPISIDTDGHIFNTVGYMDGYRLNSSGTTTAKTGSTMTGYIPAKAGDIFRMYGGSWSPSGTVDYCYLSFFDAQFTKIAHINVNSAGTYSVVQGSVLDTYNSGHSITVDENNIWTFIPVYLSGAEFAYVRASMVGNGADIIFTVNESIVLNATGATGNPRSPSVTWKANGTEADHVGDLYVDTETGYVYRWDLYSGVYEWQRVKDQDIDTAQDAAYTAQGMASEASDAAQNAQNDIDNLAIGGSNLIRNSNFASGLNSWVKQGLSASTISDSTYGTALSMSSTAAGSSSYRIYAQTGSTGFSHVQGETYTLSFMAKASASTNLQSNVGGTANTQNHALTTSWKRFTKTYTATSTGSLTFWPVSANVTIYITNVKLEKGNRATDWSPHQNDIVEEGGKTATNYLNFSTDGLIIGDHTAGTLHNNILINSDEILFRNGDTVLARYSDNLIELGTENNDASVSLCGGRGIFSTEIDEMDRAVVGFNSTEYFKITAKDGYRIDATSFNEQDNYSSAYISASTLTSMSSISISCAYDLGDSGQETGDINVYSGSIYLSTYTPSNDSQLTFSLDSSVNEFNFTGGGNVIVNYGNVQADYGFYSANNYGYWCKNTSGANINMVTLNSSNIAIYGNGAYSNSYDTRLAGKDVYIYSKQAGSKNFRPYYRPGDSVTVTFRGAGFVSGSKKGMQFSVPLSKALLGVSAVSITTQSNKLTIRQGTNYLYGSTSSAGVAPSSYDAYIQGTDFIGIVANFDDHDTTGVTNNDALGIVAHIKLTFS